MPLTAGTRLAQYEIVGPIGSGGMGNVYRARDLRLGREVAVKVMAEHIAADPEMRQRFETEARAIASLSHPGIPSMYELAMIDGRPAAVMELLEGVTLRDRLDRGPIAWQEAVETAAAIAEALAAAHAKGVIHRDLKPENVFITSDGSVKVLDFGLALQRVPLAFAGDLPTAPHTAAGVVLGTFGYMSPEQVCGDAVDGRSDVFSLGCVLYEMLSGRRLFGGASPQEIIANLLRGALPEMSAFNPLAPTELRSIVTRCLDRKPAGRFDSARDVAVALRALLTGSAGRPAGKRPRPRSKSLAILPFVNTAADATLEYLIDGITESIINSLSQLDGLRVVPRSLVFRYKGLQSDPSTVGLALNARTILTGRAAQHGDVLNIQVELVDTATESQLWGEQFRQKITDLVTVQEEIVWQISEALRLKLTGAQKKKLRQRHTVNPEAHQEYLRGRYQWNQWTPDGFRRALGHFQTAIALDPTYALAYSGLGDALGSLAYYGFIATDEGFPRSRAAAQRALELNPDLGDAHVTLALCSLFHEWNWTTAEREIKAGLKLNPKLPLGHSIYALYLSSSARHEEALAEARLARNLEPLSVFGAMGVCWALFFAGRYSEARDEAVRVRQLVPKLEEAGSLLVNAHEYLGDLEAAAGVISQLHSWGGPASGDALLAAYREGGATAYWETRLQLMDRAPGCNGARILFQYAAVQTRLEKYDEAIQYLQRVVDSRFPGSIFIAADAAFECLWDRPAFQALVTELGAPVMLQRSAS